MLHLHLLQQTNQMTRMQQDPTHMSYRLLTIHEVRFVALSSWSDSLFLFSMKDNISWLTVLFQCPDSFVAMP